MSVPKRGVQCLVHVRHQRLCLDHAMLSTIEKKNIQRSLENMNSKCIFDRLIVENLNKCE